MELTIKLFYNFLANFFKVARTKNNLVVKVNLQRQRKVNFYSLQKHILYYSGISNVKWRLIISYNFKVVKRYTSVQDLKTWVQSHYSTHRHILILKQYRCIILLFRTSPLAILPFTPFFKAYLKHKNKSSITFNGFSFIQ